MGVLVSVPRFVSTAPWTPLNLPSLAGWWDASDAATFSYSSGVLVSQWNDKSGSARNFTQATVTNQPSRNGSENGLTTVVFDGIDNYMDTSAFTLTQALTLIVVVNSNTATTDRAMLSSVGGSLQTYVSASNTQVRMEAGTGVSIGATAPVRGRHIYGFTFDGAASLAYQDGVLLGTLASSPGTAGTTTGLRISERNLATWFDGEMMEIIATDDVLSAGDWASVNSYLNNKWIFKTITDSFNRADSTTTLGSTDTGQTWTALLGTWGISSNQAYPATANADGSAVVSVGSPDQAVQATMNTDGYQSVIARVADVNNYYMGEHSVADVSIFKKVSGTYTLVSTLSFAGVAGNVVYLSANGTALTLKVNGVSKISTTDSTLVAGNSAGIRGVVGTMRWDDFSVTVP